MIGREGKRTRGDSLDVMRKVKDSALTKLTVLPVRQQPLTPGLHILFYKARSPESYILQIDKASDHTIHKKTTTTNTHQPLSKMSNPPNTTFTSASVSSFQETRLSPNELNALIELYIEYTVKFLEWLHREACPDEGEQERTHNSLISLCPERITNMARAVANRGVTIPLLEWQCWEKSLKLRRRVLRHEQARCEGWDNLRRERVTEHMDFVRVLEEALVFFARGGAEVRPILIEDLGE